MDTKYNMIMNYDAIKDFQERNLTKLDFYVELKYLFGFLNGSIVNNELKVPVYYNKRTIYEAGRVYNETILNSFVTVTFTREMVDYLCTLRDGENDAMDEDVNQVTEIDTHTQVLDDLWGDESINDLTADVKKDESIGFIHIQGEMTSNDLNLLFVENITLGEVIKFNNPNNVSKKVLTWRLYKLDDNLDELLITADDYARMQAIIDAEEEAKHQAEIAEIEQEMQAIIEAPLDDDDADLAEVFNNFNERHLSFYNHNSYVIYILYGVIAFLMTLVVILATTAA